MAATGPAYALGKPGAAADARVGERQPGALQRATGQSARSDDGGANSRVASQARPYRSGGKAQDGEALDAGVRSARRAACKTTGAIAHHAVQRHAESSHSSGAGAEDTGGVCECGALECVSGIARGCSEWGRVRQI